MKSLVFCMRSVNFTTRLPLPGSRFTFWRIHEKNTFRFTVANREPGTRRRELAHTLHLKIYCFFRWFNGSIGRNRRNRYQFWRSPTKPKPILKGSDETILRNWKVRRNDTTKLICPTKRFHDSRNRYRYRSFVSFRRFWYRRNESTQAWSSYVALSYIIITLN